MSAESEPNDAPEGIWLARLSAVPTRHLARRRDLFDTAEADDDLRVDPFRRPRPRTERRSGRPPRKRRLPQRRQDERHEVRLRRPAEPALQDQPDRARADRRAPAAAPPPRSLRGSRTPRSAPTPAARSGSPPPAAGSSASSRRTGSSRSTAASPSRRPSIRRPMARTVAGCTACSTPSHRGSNASPHVGAPSGSPGTTAAHRSSAADPRGSGTARCPAGRLPPSTRHRQRVHARSRRRPPRSLR